MPMDSLKTQRLNLVLEDRDEALKRVEMMPEEYKRELSDEWLAKLRNAQPNDPWILGFNLVLHEGGKNIGQCGFKGPPSDRGEVEIAYAIEPEWQGQGFATEAAAALTQFAFAHPDVHRVLAHTLPEENASVSVLKKAGFEQLGEVIDPDDGLVWRFEKTR